MAENEETIMTKTKEKILFETNELVISLNTQVAVLANANKTLNDTIQGYIEKMDKKIDKMDERDATLDQRVTIMRNDLTREEGKTDTLRRDVDELRKKSNLFDLINLLITGGVGAVLYFLGLRQP
jgi:predicted RNase H-like nuclease (RuvC/YqgF family)